MLYLRCGAPGKGHPLLTYLRKTPCGQPGTCDTPRVPFVCEKMDEKKKAKPERPDRSGAHRSQFEKNKKKIYATQTVCGICGKPVDFSLKYPHPLSKCIDHIIPVDKGGHPSDLANLQLAHWTCNRQKSDKLLQRKGIITNELDVISNRVLPQSRDWKSYREDRGA